MLTRFSAKQYLMLGTALTGVAAFVTPTAALADCLINATNDTVTCTTTDTNGFQSAINLLTINVTPGATVSGTTLLAPAPILSAGTQSVVNNEGDISNVGAPAGSVAISLGGGSRVTEASTATGSITGDILFGAAGTGQTNTLENLNTAATITGNITSAGGAFLVTNNGGITGNITSSGNTTINNSGTLTGNVTLGAGNDTITDTGTISGTVDMGTGTNVFNAANGAQLPTLLTAAAAGTNTVNLGSGGGTVGAITNFDVMNVNGGVSFWLLNQPITLSDRINVNSGVLE